MNYLDVFQSQALGETDAGVVARVFQLLYETLEFKQCWCLESINHAAFKNFTTSTPAHARYNGRDARILFMALINQYPPNDEKVLIRRACCKSKHCLNPLHYYWGSKAEVALEREKNKKTGLTPEIMHEIRTKYKENKKTWSSKRLMAEYNLPYHTVNRICRGAIYDIQSVKDLSATALQSESKTSTVSIQAFEKNLQSFQENFKTIEKISQQELKKMTQHIKDIPETTCIWHKFGMPNHKGKFGLMNECLDCMEEINKGRCEIDVKNFNLNTYWTVKAFWEKVSIGNQNECWHWTGAIKKNGLETVAYLPSPFHSAKTQTAARVAYWTSRGYSGRYRVGHKQGCNHLCCNPLHLHLKRVEIENEPKELKVVNLSYGNIFNQGDA